MNLPKPRDKEDMYLNYLAAGQGDLPIPTSKKHLYLDYIAKNSIEKYPFDFKATLKHMGTDSASIDNIKNAIKDIIVLGGEAGSKYCISSISRCVSNEMKYIINISKEEIDSSLTVVGIGEIWNYEEPSSIDEFRVNKVGVNGVSAIVYIDWTHIPINCGYYGMGYSETGIDKKCIYKTPKCNAKILIPGEIYITKGTDFDIHHRNIIKCDNLSNYNISYTCENAGVKQFEECTRININEVGQYNLSISVLKDGIVEDSKNVKIIVSDNSPIGSQIKGLFMGDSHTQNNWYVDETKNGLDGKLTLLGTKGDWCIHEGRGGWSTKHYLCQDGLGLIDNPFKNEKGEFDISYYFNTSHVDVPNFFSILLGTNDLFSVTSKKFISNINEIVSNIKQFDNNIKIFIGILPPVCASQDACGKNNGTWKKEYEYREKVFEFTERIIEAFDNRRNENIYLVPCYLGVDTLMDFETEEVPISIRNKDIIIKRHVDIVHPSKFGYFKFADAYIGVIRNLYK